MSDLPISHTRFTDKGQFVSSTHKKENRVPDEPSHSVKNQQSPNSGFVGPKSSTRDLFIRAAKEAYVP